MISLFSLQKLPIASVWGFIHPDKTFSSSEEVRANQRTRQP